MCIRDSFFFSDVTNIVVTIDKSTVSCKLVEEKSVDEKIQLKKIILGMLTILHYSDPSHNN